MGNFDFLKSRREFELFADAAIEAERVYASSPAMCAVGCRKAVELAVKWMYAADSSIETPYSDNVQALIHEPTFRKAIGQRVWSRLALILKLGNIAITTKKVINSGEALNALEGLFEFIQWIDFSYGQEYVEREFDASMIPQLSFALDLKQVKEQEALFELSDSVVNSRCERVRTRSAQYTASKEENREHRRFRAKDMSEFKTRKCYIDVDLVMSGWTLPPETSRNVEFEYPVEGMMGIEGQQGFCDYVLFGRDGKPLAVVEAKRTTKDPEKGQQQAVLYADCLERRFGRRPMIFLTNGFETRFWDDRTAPPRSVSGIFSPADLDRLMTRRETAQQTDLLSVPIDDRITGRYYQKAAIRAVCEQIQKGLRKHLLVMATGTGKTRTAASLVDVLSRADRVSNVLFLADRIELVNQAKNAFNEHVPQLSLCRLGLDDGERTARVVFSTYPTMLNRIDAVKQADEGRLFAPAHFDLIIVDESHRSIFKKYHAIFDYFDAQLVGLTATPKTDVDLNTYDFFELEPNVPTYNYDYETAVYVDHVLVPFYSRVVKTKLFTDGVKYAELSDEEKAKFERVFGNFEDLEDEPVLPDEITPQQFYDWLYSESTVDIMLEDLMEHGIKIDGGDKLGKTIIFAHKKEYAQFIVERFNKLYPQYKGTFARRIVCDDSYAQSLLSDFKEADREPQIAVSVDMLDTGVDVPECVNLVFFKRTYSKIKFEQMIGRGTRLCPELACVDTVDGEYVGKRRFMIFDYCGNFEFFDKNANLREGKEIKSLSEKIFAKKVELAAALQYIDFGDDGHQNLRSELVNSCCCQVKELNTLSASVRAHIEVVEKFKDEAEFVDLCRDNKLFVLQKEIAPLVFMDDTDEFAKRFDNLLYGMMLGKIKGDRNFELSKRQVKKIALALSGKISIPQVRNKQELLLEVVTDEYWEDIDVLELENLRRDLRGLVQFLADGGKSTEKIYTNLSDHIIDCAEDVPFDFANGMERYSVKVNKYISEHKDNTVIYKLTYNEKLTALDFKELERIFTEELGSREDYEAEYGDTPFGLLVRKIAHLDHEAAEKAFSSFINNECLNSQQIEFVGKIIQHIQNNGYMEDLSMLMRPPFDTPNSIIKLFGNKVVLITNAIKEIENNALYDENGRNCEELRAAEP